MAEPGLTSVGPDGTFWLADGEAIYSRSPDGSLETVDDPAGGLSDIAGLVALSDGALVSTTGRLHWLRDGTMATIWQVGSQAGPNGNVFPSMIATDSGAWIGDGTGVWRCPAPATVDGCRLMDEGMPELRGDEGVSVALAPDGTLWATGPGGTARLDGEAWEVVGDAPGQAVTVGPDGTVWVLGSDNALAAWRDGPTGWVAEHHPPTGLICAGCGGVAWMGVRPDGSVWVLQLGFVPVYLLSFDGQTWTSQLESDVAGRPIGPFGHVHAATIDAGGHLWVVWSGPPVDEHGLPTNGVARLDDTGWTVVSEAGPAGFGGVVAGPDGSVWMGSDDGLLRYDGSGWAPAGLAGMPVTPVDVSADGAVWFIDGGAGTTALYRLPAETTAP
jgi:hypothetical protein